MSEIGIGSKVWITNWRHEQWEETEITGETRTSWLIHYGPRRDEHSIRYKIDKKTLKLRGSYPYGAPQLRFDEQAVQAVQFIDEHRAKVKDAVDALCRSGDDTAIIVRAKKLERIWEILKEVE